jgi:signal transduction histidine kinase/CheY-like chemotaxis protein
MHDFEARVRQLSILHELSTILNGSLDLDRELAAFLDALTRALPLEAAAVFDVGAGTEPAWPRASFGLSARRRAGLTLSPELLLRLREAPGGAVDDAPFDIGTARLSVLLRAESTPVGVLALASAEPLDAADRGLLEPLGRRLAVALHHGRLRDQERAAEVAVQDALRRARDAAESSNRLKDGFMTMVSHELRTPLHAVMGMSSLLLEGPLDATQAEQVRAISRSASALSSIVESVLELSGLEAGRVELADTELDLRALVRDALTAVELDASRAGLTLDAVLPDQLPGLRGDPLRIRQIFLNLVSNAVKFTERGAVRLELSVVEASEGWALVRAEVSDTGVGISSEALARLFTPFSQADASMSRRHGGMGVGLSLVRRLAELMSGQVGVESAPGRGSRFWVTLKLARTVDAAGTSPRGPGGGLGEQRGAPGLRLGRVLVAEDNRVNALLLETVLRRTGAAVDVAVDGRQACAFFEQASYDLILMDCQMPEMDGYEATRRIRATERARGTASPVLIVAVTANAQREDEQRCLEAGMDLFVSKPFTPAMLLSRLAQAFAARA